MSPQPEPERHADPGAATPGPDSSPGGLVERFMEVFRFLIRSSKRVAVLVVGGVLVLGGVAMLVLPGPGLVVIIAGLAVLATEFAWAATLLERAKEQAAKAGDAAKKRLKRKK